MAIQVYSEIATLKKVLLHRPGQELEHLVPESLERLLFDDIPYLAGAKQEHDAFARLLSEMGAHTVYLADLMVETLNGNEALRERFVKEFISISGNLAGYYANKLTDYLLNIEDTMALVLKTMTGVRLSDLGAVNSYSLSALLQRETQFVLDPMPNLYFTRDPFACIGRGASVHRMFSETRCRETIYGKYVLSFHQDYAGKVPLYYSPDEPYSLEGGDILNLSGKTLAVGASQRTSSEGIERLAANIFADPESEVSSILVMDIPGIRAYMHLDTVFTQVDESKFVIHPAIIHTLRMFMLERGPNGSVRIRQLSGSLEHALERLLGVTGVTLLRCGDRDFIASQREQWNDGSNTLCIAPGKVVTYDRNYVTNELLDKNGVQVLSIASSELSRGRGGPRCMSMPLVRTR